MTKRLNARGRGRPLRAAVAALALLALAAGLAYDLIPGPFAATGAPRQ